MENKRGNKKNKRAQGVFGMSFGMIFSIILIVFFVAVAFIAIKSFLGTQTCAQIGIFKDNLQAEVTETWPNTGDFEFKARLPTKIKYVCFMDLDKPVTATGTTGNIGRELGVYEGYIANMFLYPTENTCNMPYYEIEHLDINKTISSKNPYCIAVDDGNINMRIIKKSGDKLVTITEE
ncbi:MAG: hypothetical protein WCX73_01200 [Candidatus Pacearchaeota archaeon]|jgi:hypothetical protein